MKKIVIILFLIATALTGCNKCYECSKSSSGGSSTIGACFEKASEARDFKKDMEKNGYSCRVVPEP